MGLTKEEFFELYAEDFEEGEWPDDDQTTDVMALVVLGGVPVETINKILLQNTEVTSCPLWLADTYDNLPDFSPTAAPEGTTAPIDADWRSPFTLLEEAVEFVRNVPKPPKPLSKTFCAVLDLKRYEEFGELLFVKVDGSEVEMIPCEAGEVGTVFGGMDRDVWPDRLADWVDEAMGM